MRTLFFPAFLLAAATASADPLHVTVETTDGNFVTGVLQMETVKLKGSTGPIEIPLAEVQSIEFDGADATVTKRDGTQVTGSTAQEVWRVSSEKLGNLDLKVSALKTVTLLGATPKPPDPNGGAAGTEVRPKGELLAVWRLGSWLVPGVAASADGTGFWALDGGARKLVKFGRDPLKPIAEIKLAEDIAFWSAAPGGRKAVAASGRKLLVLDLEKATVADTLEFATPPASVLLFDEGTLVATFVSPSGGGALVDATIYSLASMEVKKRIPSSGRTFLRVPGTNELVGSGGVLRLTPETSGIGVEWRPGSGVAGGFLLNSKLVASRGTGDAMLYERSRSYLAKPRIVANLDAPSSALAFPEVNRAVLFARSGKVSTIQLEPFKIIAERDLGAVAWEALADPSGKSAIVFATTGSMLTGSEQTPRGDFFRIPLPE